jgi:hypothetical protein
VRGPLGFCRARGTQDLMKKEEEVKLPTFPCCMSTGRRKGNSVAQNNTSLFFFFNKKRCRFIQNTLFHLNMAQAYLFPNQSLIYPLFF